MTPKGTILIIGGAEDKGAGVKSAMDEKNKNFEHFEILKELLPERGKTQAAIEIIATASSMPDEMNSMYKKAIKKAGYNKVGFIKISDREGARNLEYCDRILKAHAVMFTGGDQFMLSAMLAGTPVVDCIKDKLYGDPDFVVAGTSAGAMALSKIMIYEDGVEEALLKTDLRITSGLGIFDTCIIDTHFIQRGRFGRLVNAIIMNPESLGIGLGEDTALIIKKGTEAECRGSGSTIIIDGIEIGQTNIAQADDHTSIFVENLRVHILANSCRFSIKDRRMAQPAVSPVRSKALKNR
ncbi:MAG: cyanophycinase [Chitinophagaceae bacterium]|nr:cyanophycinase [Chitinophagaceae bacterium]